MSGAFNVVCTGRGTHKSRPFNKVTVTDDEIRVRNFRVANKPGYKGKVLDGITVVHKAILTAAYAPRVGDDSWR